MSSSTTAPEVDLTVGKKKLPPEILATLNPFQRRMRSIFGFTFFVLIAFTIGSLPVIGIPPVLYFLQWAGLAPHWLFRRFFDLCTANWMAVMTMVYEHMFGIKVRTFGYNGVFKRRSLIIMNHLSHMDWMYMWSVIDRQGDLSFWKAITKRWPIRSLPILGQSMQMSCFIFIDRKWEVDKLELRDKLYYFNAINSPIQLLLFPEGRDFTPKAKKRSDQYAKENNLPFYNYCLQPHTTGFKYAINALRDGGLDAVYDMTIAYPDVFPKTEVDIIKTGIIPKEVHFHINKHDDKEIPREQDGLDKWLRDRWTEKEERLKEFYRHGKFWESSQTSDENCDHIGNQKGLKSPEVLKPRNLQFFLYSVFIFILTNLILLIPMWYYPYFRIYMLLGCIFLWFGHRSRGMGHLYMTFKRKEVEKAIKESKFNY